MEKNGTFWVHLMSLRLDHKTGLEEVPIESIGDLDPVLSHHCKRNAVCQRVPLVLMPREVIPCVEQEWLVNVNQIDRRTLQKNVSYRHSL